MKSSSEQVIQRRQFLGRAAALVLTNLVANVGVYAVGSAVKKLDGNLVAGAKVCTWFDLGGGGPESSCGFNCCDGSLAGQTCANWGETISHCYAGSPGTIEFLECRCY